MMLYADAKTTTRVRTPEGMLRADAVLTRAGLFEYGASELGLGGDGVVTVRRTMDTLRHPKRWGHCAGRP